MQVIKIASKKPNHSSGHNTDNNNCNQAKNGECSGHILILTFHPATVDKYSGHILILTFHSTTTDIHDYSGHISVLTFYPTTTDKYRTDYIYTNPTDPRLMLKTTPVQPPKI